MTFHHETLEYPELVEDYQGIGRHYTTPDGNRYPSVTTILGLEPKPGLDKWRERVGDEEADRKMKASSRVGSEFHDACERFVLNQDVGVLSKGASRLFSTVKRSLVKNLGTVYGTEIPMWSDKLKIAGRSDLIGEWCDDLAIIDYKNSRNFKPIEYCTGYFKQGACYSKMLHERHGLVAKKIVIIIGVWGVPKPTVYVQNVSDWYPKVLDHMKKYHPMWG